MKLGIRGELASALGRLASWGSKASGRGSGGMIGGRVAMAVDPKLLQKLTAEKRVVIVTGTNGKSTTTAMLRQALLNAGSVACNTSGDNMTDGVLAALLANPDAPFAALEVDELYVPKIARLVRPAGFVFLNLSRDQLDRVGEITSVEARLRQAVAENPQAFVVANCDDPLVTSATWDAKHPIWVSAGATWTADSVSFPRTGTPVVRKGEHWEVPQLSDSLEGEAADASLEASAGSLSDAPAAAPASDAAPDPTPTSDAALDPTPTTPVFARPTPDWWLEDHELHHAGEAFELALALPGRANRGNAAQAIAAAHQLGVSIDQAIARVNAVSEVSGRYTRQNLDGRLTRILLAKNPAGWQESLSMLDTHPADKQASSVDNEASSAGYQDSSIENQASHPTQARETPTSSVILSVNGQVGDGEDLSWLWDVDFSVLRNHPGSVLVCGERGTDMAVRLRYDDIECQLLKTTTDAVRAAPVGSVDLLANYTAFRDFKIAMTTDFGKATK